MKIFIKRATFSYAVYFSNCFFLSSKCLYNNNFIAVPPITVLKPINCVEKKFKILYAAEEERQQTKTNQSNGNNRQTYLREISIAQLYVFNTSCAAFISGAHINRKSTRPESRQK